MALARGDAVRYVGEPTGQLAPGMRGVCVSDEDAAGFVRVRFGFGTKKVDASDLVAT